MDRTQKTEAACSETDSLMAKQVSLKDQTDAVPLSFFTPFLLSFLFLDLAKFLFRIALKTKILTRGRRLTVLAHKSSAYEFVISSVLVKIQMASCHFDASISGLVCEQPFEAFATACSIFILETAKRKDKYSESWNELCLPYSA